jgi:two-component sensor histidine kinase
LTIAAALFWGRLWSRTRRQIREQDTYISIAMEESGLATWESNLHTGEAIWSPRHFDILGYPQHPDGSGSSALWWDRVHPDDLVATREQWDATNGQPGGLVRLTYRIIRHDDGEVRWCESIARVLGDGRLIGVMLDVTEARRDEEQRLLLAREVDHRSKNLLAVVQAMVSMTQARDVDALRTALAARILSLAKTHTLLARNGWAGSTLGEVAANELGSHGRAISFGGDDVSLKAEAVQPLAMVLHELATNSTKYGGLSTTGGRVAVSWRLAEDAMVAEWMERGGPTVTPPETRGFGTRMMVRVLSQIGGSIDFTWHPAGLAARITLPLARIRR